MHAGPLLVSSAAKAALGPNERHVVLHHRADGTQTVRARCLAAMLTALTNGPKLLTAIRWSESG